jgi:hypothetical protein
MSNPTRKARLALAIVAALLALPTASASAAAPAGDEYVLEIPGVRQTDAGPVAAAEESGGGAGGVQRGVVGENDPPASPLSALGDAIAAVPASLSVAVAALLALALTAGRRRPVAHSSR